jgi:Fe-S cluster assembly iron-binding protein IscA
MEIEVTPQAAEVLARSVQLMGGRGIRLRVSRGLGGGESVQVEVAAGPEPGDHTTESAGVTLYVEPQVLTVIPQPVLALEPQHEQVSVRSRQA